ncbi:MAG: amino acid ABC transporter permease [Rubricella sp.]
MSDTHAQSIAFVRREQLPPMPPPAAERGVVKWLRENLFSGPINTILTLVSLYIVYVALAGLLPWLFNSVWNAGSLSECREIAEGACFAVIRERWPQFLFGFYPRDEYWRPVLSFLLLFIALAPVLFSQFVPRIMLAFTGLFPFIAYWLLWGGTIWFPISVLAGFVIAFFVFRAVMQFSFPVALGAGIVALGFWSFVLVAPITGVLQGIIPIALTEVDSRDIGGFTLTVILGVTGITLALPLGVLLALGRKSNLFIITSLCVIFIEFVRGVPLITLLFTANVLLAYFLPPGTTFDLILRVVIMITLFAAAYIAEVIRGGLAALPRGQYEAADSLGLDYWQAMRLIILPQALKISIPGIVNVFIGLYKDTTLVAIISMFDMIGLSNAVRADSNWNGIIWEIYGFIALLFFISCYSMSQYSQYLERRLRTDHR